jgi:hypothetical protein
VGGWGAWKLCLFADTSTQCSTHQHWVTAK